MFINAARNSVTFRGFPCMKHWPIIPEVGAAAHVKALTAYPMFIFVIYSVMLGPLESVCCPYGQISCFIKRECLLLCLLKPTLGPVLRHLNSVRSFKSQYYSRGLYGFFKPLFAFLSGSGPFQKTNSENVTQF